MWLKALKTKGMREKGNKNGTLREVPSFCNLAEGEGCGESLFPRVLA